MKILTQISIIFGLYWLCQVVEQFLPFPIPASVLSLLILLVLLWTRVVKEEQVQDVADFLPSNLALFFVPAAVGILKYVDVIRENALAFAVICVVTTVLTFGVTVGVGGLTKKLMERGKNHE